MPPRKKLPPNGARPRLNEAQKAARAAEVLRLRVEEGLSLRKIGQRMGIWHTTVMDIIAESCAKTRDPLVAELRRIEDERLDYLLERLAPAIEEGDVKAIEAARKISESRRRLYGADGPVAVNVSVEETPTDREVAELFAQAEAFLASEERKVYGDRDGD